MSSNTDKSSATRRTNQAQEQEKLAELEERLAHELMDDEERQQLRDRIIGMRRTGEAREER